MDKTPQLRLTFDRPQFDLLPDNQGVRWYANVYNRMEVLAHGNTYHVAVAVPTGMFTLMKDVLKLPTEGNVQLSIDQFGERFVFSALCENYDGDKLVDLWDYSEKSLPAWILSREFRL